MGPLKLEYEISVVLLSPIPPSPDIRLRDVPERAIWSLRVGMGEAG